MAKDWEIITVSTKVRFHPLPAHEIEAYVASGGPMDKGAYGIHIELKLLELLLFKGATLMWWFTHGSILRKLVNKLSQKPI